jgi:arsenite methyltransferase
VDTNQEFLIFINNHAKEQGVSNSIALYSKSDHPNLPKRMFDYIFLRNVTHHVSNKINYFKGLGESLKLNGILVIIEYDEIENIFSFQRLQHHYVPSDILCDEMEQAGYKVKEKYNLYLNSNFFVFFLR